MNGIFMNTIQLIGSIILFAIFLSISYGVFSGTLESMLWDLFYKLIEILKPITAIALLILGAFKLPTWIESLINSMLEDMRAEREEIKFWENISSPTPSSNTQNLSQEGTNSTNTEVNTQSRGEGEEVIIWVSSDNGAIARHVKKGTLEYDAAIKERSEAQRKVFEKQSEIRQEELRNTNNEILEKHKQRLMGNY